MLSASHGGEKSSLEFLNDALCWRTVCRVTRAPCGVNGGGFKISERRRDNSPSDNAALPFGCRGGRSVSCRWRLYCGKTSQRYRNRRDVFTAMQQWYTPMWYIIVALSSSGVDHTVFKFRVRRSRSKMYIRHGRLCVCVCLCVCPSPHFHTITRTRM